MFIGGRRCAQRVLGATLGQHFGYRAAYSVGKRVGRLYWRSQAGVSGKRVWVGDTGIGGIRKGSFSATPVSKSGFAGPLRKISPPLSCVQAVESAAIIDRSAGKMNTMMSDLIGYTAASCTTISFLPQVIKALRDRDTQSLSLGMYFIFTAGACLWCVYGYVRHEMVIVIANSITASFCLLILIVKMRNDVFGRQVK